MSGAVEREKYLTPEEATRLRTVAEAWAVVDHQRGRVTGPRVWVVVDLALSTGLRVGELARITHGDLNPKLGSLKAHRLKKKSPTRETLALGKELVEHLKAYTDHKRHLGLSLNEGDAVVGRR